MIFRGIIFNAILVGLLAGLVLTIVQQLSVAPIIFAAEAYEVADEPAVVHEHEHEHGEAVIGHHHDEEAWAPEDGTERTLYSLLSNVLAGVGFSAVLMAVMTQLSAQGVAQLNLLKGAIWGVGGFLALFVIPGLGLPPEIPGAEAAAIENRQTWWLLATVCSAMALLVLFYGPFVSKFIAPLLLALPFILGAPHADAPMFSHPDPVALAALNSLHEEFLWASGAANLVFWLVLGVAAAWAVKRIVSASASVALEARA
ncbi:cobalt transporter subunit CbtA [Sinobacterium caligoides]|uniref:Cobalt transporter subunit CbtA n=1 Tax=Sinobacterium caligoides TaxID=933926 RepID=A0A3N2DZN6_9GAMM|nr:CbtA family protein [Sinobacterium caligoides]ROS04899.1 cobalt transporter subunit CbtA [Sinobacterium caligoides]